MISQKEVPVDKCSHVGERRIRKGEAPKAAIGWTFV